MRLLLFLLGICVGMVGTGTHAEAQNYPWCAIYSEGAAGGGTNCGFTTFEQCMETARGLGSNSVYCFASVHRRTRSGTLLDL
jgi:hypothetical protein